MNEMAFVETKKHLQILKLGAHMIRRPVHFGENLRLLGAPYGHKNTVNKKTTSAFLELFMNGMRRFPVRHIIDNLTYLHPFTVEMKV